jgi:peptide/nickel transport system substrate-binding protein
MYTTTMTQPDPALHMLQFVSWEAASKDNKWQGRNITRWQSPECDKLYRESESELDPVKRAALFIKMNDLAIQNHIVLGVVQRPTVSALAGKLNAQISGWDNNTSDLSDWFKEA